MKEKFSKLASVFKKYGFFGFVKKLYAYIVANYFDKVSFAVLFCPRKYRKELDRILSGDYERVVLWRSSFGYHVPLFQRPQHIANNLSKNGCLVFYEVTTMTDRVKTLAKQAEGLYLFNFNNVLLRRMLEKKLAEIECPKYVQLYSTDWKLSVQNIKDYMAAGYGFLYEYIDHLSPELAGTSTLPQNIIDKYEFAMQTPEVFVVYSAKALGEDVFEHRGTQNSVLATNGVDAAFFKALDPDFAFDEDFLKAKNSGKITVGYYGALASWFDYELIRKLDATDRYTVILLGIKYDDSFDQSGIGDLKNVFFLGPRDYSVLKNYAAAIDILTIPFVLNDITRATSPLKLFEYMALSKPIVTSDMDECRKYESVLIAHSHDEFLQKLEEAYQKRGDAEYLALLEKEARENDWSEKTRAILQMIREHE